MMLGPGGHPGGKGSCLTKRKHLVLLTGAAQELDSHSVFILFSGRTSQSARLGEV